jgi:hypothetical protein
MRPPKYVSSDFSSGAEQSKRTDEVGSSHSNSRNVGALVLGLFELQLKIHHELDMSACLDIAWKNTYLDPLTGILTQLVENRGDGIMRYVVLLENVVAFLSLLGRAALNFVVFLQLLRIVLLALCISRKESTKTHRDRSTEEFRQSTDDDQFGRAQAISC